MSPLNSDATCVRSTHANRLVAPTFGCCQKDDGPGLHEPFAFEGRAITRAGVARQHSYVLRESVFSVISGSYEIYSHPDGRSLHIYYTIPQGQKYWWILNTPGSLSTTGNTIDELMGVLSRVRLTVTRPRSIQSAQFLVGNSSGPAERTIPAPD